VPTDARETARRIVVEVFGPGDDPSSGPSSEVPEEQVAVPAAPAERPAPTGRRPASAAERRARELVSEVFDPPAPEPEVPPAPTAAELAGRRIAAEAEAAQRARAEERAAAAAAARRAAREAAEAQERDRARRVREEWAARARAEQEAEQERRRAAALAQAERERTERLQREAAASRSVGEAPAAPADEPAPPSARSPVAGVEEALFRDATAGAVGPADDGLFEPELAGLPASLSEDVDGPPAPPADQLPLRLAEGPPAPQLAARLVSDVLEAQSDRDQQVAVVDGSATPSATQEADRPRRVARWLVVTVLAAVSLAVLFPLAVRAVLQLVSLS